MSYKGVNMSISINNNTVMAITSPSLPRTTQITEENKEKILTAMQDKFSLAKGNSLVSIEA